MLLLMSLAKDLVDCSLVCFLRCFEFELSEDFV